MDGMGGMNMTDMNDMMDMDNMTCDISGALSGLVEAAVAVLADPYNAPYRLHDQLM